MSIIKDALKGVSPSYAIMQEIIDMGLGHYTGGFHDKWDWHGSAVDELTDEEAEELYNRIKHYE